LTHWTGKTAADAPLPCKRVVCTSTAVGRGDRLLRTEVARRTGGALGRSSGATVGACSTVDRHRCVLQWAVLTHWTGKAKGGTSAGLVRACTAWDRRWGCVIVAHGPCRADGAGSGHWGAVVAQPTSLAG
jgi:hypothetical protein